MIFRLFLIWGIRFLIICFTIFSFGIFFKVSHFLPYVPYFRSMQARYKGNTLSIHGTVLLLQSHMLFYLTLLVLRILIRYFAASTFKSSS